MIEKTLSKRYAAALLKATEADGSTEETEQYLFALKQVYLTQKDFRGLLAQPRVPRTVKKGLLRRIFEGKAKPSFLSFLELLVDKNRQNLIPDIADSFDTLSDMTRGVVRIQVHSWRPLTDAQRAQLEVKLQKFAARKVILEVKVDPAVKGGLLCYAGGLVVDGTVASRLRSIEEKFKELQKI
ncbi:MAG TPA: ATP synthase F1 subunit delta [Planctomycetota bacterium]|nr:ATP synthase F1 subunit delta [Planctomycetota bacterium]